MQMAIANQLQPSEINELTPAEIEQISGGNVLVIAAGVAAAFGALNAAEAFGQKLGKALYYAIN